MKKKDIDELKHRVPCAAVLESAGFAIDLKESTRKAVKYRRGDDIIIVIHDGKGWFDALSDAKGDVFSLVEHLDGVGFTEVLQRVSDLVGFEPSEPVWMRASRTKNLGLCIGDRWQARRKPWRGSLTWCYLRDERAIPESVKRYAERKEAGRVLLKEILTLVQLQQEGETVIGSIGGFDIEYSGERIGRESYRYTTMLIRTNAEYEIELPVTVTPLGAISRLEHALDDFEGERERFRQRLADARRRLAAYQSRDGGDFAFAGELANKRRQLAEIEEALASDIEGAGEARAIAA